MVFNPCLVGEEVHAFPKGYHSESECNSATGIWTDYDIAVQHISHYAMGISLVFYGVKSVFQPLELLPNILYQKG